MKKIVSVEEPFVSLEVAKVLKANGFAYAESDDIKRVYKVNENLSKDKAIKEYIDNFYGEKGYIISKSNGNNISNATNFYDAPSYSLALKWIEVNFYFHISLSPRSWETNIVKWSVWGDELKEHYFCLSLDDRQDEPYDTKEEALDAAILALFEHTIPHFEKLYIKIDEEKKA